jgi:uncharacterized protein (TIGR02265 family)
MKIKGFILHSRKEFVTENFGNDAWNSVLEALPEDHRTLLNDTLLTGKWYDFEVGKQLDLTIVDVLGEGAKKVFEDIGAQSAQRNLTSIHSSFIEGSDPQSFLKKAGMIYKFYYDVGHREYEETSPNSGFLTTYDAETYSVPDCLTVIGWYKEALKMCGAKNVDVEEETCRAVDGEFCRYKVSWEN